jgi:hypothetical protein
MRSFWVYYTHQGLRYRGKVLPGSSGSISNSFVYLY